MRRGGAGRNWPGPGDQHRSFIGSVSPPTRISGALLTMLLTLSYLIFIILLHPSFILIIVISWLFHHWLIALFVIINLLSHLLTIMIIVLHTACMMMVLNGGIFG